MMNVFEKIISQVEAELESSEKFMREYDDGIAQKAYYSGMAHILYIIQKEVKEHNNGWIPCSERLPEEHDSMFAKLKGTDKWSDAMFEKISDDVNATVEFEDGTRKTMTLHTNDGKWNTNNRIVKFNVIAWQPLPQPYKERD